MSDDPPGDRVPWEDLDAAEREQFAAMVSKVVDIDDVEDAKPFYGNRERLEQAAREQSDNPRMGDPRDVDEGEGPPSFYRAGPMLMPVPDHADRSEPLEPPSFDEYGKRCPECGANTDPWVGEDVVGVGFDVGIIDGTLSVVVDAECTCGWSDRVVLQ